MCSPSRSTGQVCILKNSCIIDLIRFAFDVKIREFVQYIAKNTDLPVDREAEHIRHRIDDMTRFGFGRILCILQAPYAATLHLAP